MSVLGAIAKGALRQHKNLEKAPKIVTGILRTLQKNNDALELIIQRGEQRKPLIIPLVWLRDHCRHPRNYNEVTKQRKSNAVDILEKATIDETTQSVNITDGTTLAVRWKDGLESEFHINDLIESALFDQKPETRGINLWKKLNADELPRLEMSSLNMKSFVEMFVKYGFVMVDGVEATAEATEALCKKIAPIHDTFFGAFWVFSNQTQENGEEYHEDTAYGNEEIGPHTDGTYFNQTPGVQVFHCLHPAEEGGDTLLVDGFRCADSLKKANPGAFEMLSKRKIEHHYIEGENTSGALYSTSLEKSVIELDSQGNMVQIRFNPYDRAPFRALKEGEDSILYARDALAYYQSYSAFSSICHAPENSTAISLRPGTVIFLDNYRVLHSRTSFKGWRQMCGCYLSRDNLMAKARPLLPTKIRRFI
ncbi:unnamed protein product [Cylicocyclus nassatus]|uniref:Trimethyllysine dioxygenase, mitochondrial n=1 Tax=Cylicocyclus nassatus TaxID=53992 RepID=A0AA36MET0_CYLNA|nr:unnamed protein product [Cylicocyclus nassatus]